jgi:flagellar basal body-associated protein FliL
MIIALVNTLAVLGAAGFMAYTKIVFKRPPITETTERKRLAEAPKTVEANKPGVVMFDPLVVNIRAYPDAPKPADGTARQIEGKLHYAQIGFGLEVRSEDRKGEIETLRPIIVDKIISLLGRKAFHDLTTIQGRYLVRQQILDLVNEVIAAAKTPEGEEPIKETLVTNVFFTHFFAQ